MPDCHVMARSDQQDDLSRPWRCEPCGYSTNINSNLRIHLSSEKHAMAVRKLDAVFLCGICTKFTAESADQLENHVNRWRHVDEEFGLTQQADFFICNLCNYKTQVRITFWHETGENWQKKQEISFYICFKFKPMLWAIFQTFFIMKNWSGLLDSCKTIFDKKETKNGQNVLWVPSQFGEL